MLSKNVRYKVNVQGNSMSFIRCCLITCIFLFAISVTGKADIGNTQADQWLGHIVLPTGNYVENGSFERSLSGWDIFNGKTVGAVDTSVHFSGAASLRESGASPQNHYLYQYNLPLETGHTYTLSAMVKTQGLAESMRKQGVVTLANYGWSDAVSLVPDAATMDWKRISVTFKAMPTKPRPDGAPTYNLVLYWAPQTQGTVWLDDIQIEERNTPSPYNETSAQAAIKTFDGLRALAANLLDMREVAGYYANHELSIQATANIEVLLQAAAGVRDRLQHFTDLSYTEQRSLPDKVTEISGKLARIRTMAWLGSADIPLDNVKPPESMPDNLSLDLTCVQGEHRDVALNLANLSGQSYAARIAPSELYDAEHAIETPASQWVQLYSVPRIRGFAQPARLFTDPLPTLDNAGLIYVEPATVSQAIISLDTSHFLPGMHEGTISFDSLQDSTDHLEIKVNLHILPVTLPALTGVDIADCYGVSDYAWPGVKEVGINTFSVNVRWINADFDEHGNLTSMDFDRVAQQIHDDLAQVKDARFHFLSLGLLVNTLQQHGWKPHQPEFENAVKQWLQAVTENMNKLGVSTERLRIETIDEPGAGDLKPATYLAGLVKATVPEMQTQIYLTGISRDADWQAMAKAHDIITPSVSACTPENMAFLKTLGSRLWIYDAQANGETLNPIAYYRLMPWMADQYDIAGWSQFSWVNTIRGRPYHAWDGVEAQNMVYPSSDNQDAVFSRRLLAMRAGNEDYRTLRLLNNLIATAPASSDPQVVQARDFLEHAPEKALALAPRQPGYQTHLVPNAPQGLLDSLREEAVGHIFTLLNPKATPTFTVALQKDNPGIIMTTPISGQANIRYLVDGQLPWGEVSRPIEAGRTTIDLPVDSGKISRCIVQFITQDGRIAVQNTGIIPTMSADSNADGYSTRPLNDGIRAVSSKFEPNRTWISAASDSEHWVVAKFPRQQVNSITLYWMTYVGLPRQFMVQYHDSNTDSWKAVSSTPSWVAANSPIQQIHFDRVTSDSIRILVARQGGGTGSPSMVGLSEVEVALLPFTP